MANNTPIIELKGVSFSYDDKEVLAGLSFKVKRGEFLGVIGPNGAGKTTLLRLLGRLLLPSRGTVSLDGNRTSELSPHQVARLVAFVPQEFNMVYPFRVSEVVLMGRHPHLGGFLAYEENEDLEVARRAMKLTDCFYLADKYFNELSGGEKQRVIIAAALAQRPSVLLLDEPTSNLDLKHQVLVYALLKELQREEGLTVIGVTHDLNLASLFTDRLLLLKDGRPVKLASSGKVLRKPALEKVYETNLLVGRRRSGKVYVLPDLTTSRKEDK